MVTSEEDLLSANFDSKMIQDSVYLLCARRTLATPTKHVFEVVAQWRDLYEICTLISNFFNIALRFRGISGDIDNVA